MKIKMTEKEYLMECVSRWDSEIGDYVKPTEREMDIAYRDLRELCERCKKLLRRAKDRTQDHSYLRTLWLAKSAMHRKRYDIACGYLYDMLYFHSTGDTVDRKILVNIIATVEEELYA